MKKFFYIICTILVLAFCVFPLLNLFSLPHIEDYLTVFDQQNIYTTVLNTFLVSVTVGMFCLLLGLPLAWLMTRTNLPFKNIFRTLFCLPYVIPAFVGAIGWIILANPSSGVLNQWFGLHINIYSFWGLVFVETSFLFTFVLLTSLSILDQMDSSLEEAARLSGANGLQVFKDIALPLLKPAILSGFISSMLATVASFGVPSLIGNPARLLMLTTQIYSFQRLGTEHGLKLSVALSVILAVSTLILLFFSNSIFSKSKLALVTGKSSRPSLVSLNKFTWPIFIFLTCIFIIIFVLPLMALLLSALSPVQGDWNLKNLTFNNYSRVLFQTEETVRALLQSLILGLVSALICTAFAFIFGYYTLRSKYKGRSGVNLLASLPFTLPGTVIALAMILTFSRNFFGLPFSLYNTLSLMALAYIIKYLNLSLKTVSDGYQQIHPSLEEAAQISGANWLKIMATIYFPLLKTALMASLFLVFMPVLCELTMTLFLTGPGLETIGTLIFSFQEYSDMGGGGASVLATVVIVFILILNFSLKKLSNGRYGL